MLVLDPHKGFLFVPSQHTSRDKVHSNGFDQLNWDEHLQIEESDTTPETDTREDEDVLSPRKLSRKMRKELKQQKKASARKLRQARNEIAETFTDPDFNEYTAKHQIKRIHDKILKKNTLPDSTDFKVFHYESIAFSSRTWTILCLGNGSMITTLRSCMSCSRICS